MPFVVTFIVLSVAGIIDAGYLFMSHREHKPLVCPLDHDCSIVTESRWATIFFGIRNEVLGLLYYIALFGSVMALLAAPEFAARVDLPRLILYATGAGLAFSIFLVGIQKFVLKNYCFYCLISALLSLLLFVNSFALR